MAGAGGGGGGGGACDLALSAQFDFTHLGVLEKMGYRTVAINNHVEESAFESKKKKKKGESREKQDYFPLPAEKPQGSSLKLLQRISFEFSDSSIAHRMNQSENLKKYDIIAVIPKTASAFQYACGSMEIDIITFQPESKLPFKISRKLYRQATDRGIYFELMYAPAIKDATCRKNIINVAHTYHAIGKSRNLLLTSSAESHMQIRGIYDLINLGIVLGLNENQCRDVLTRNARNVLLKAEGRRCGKSFLQIVSPPPASEEDIMERKEDSENLSKKIKLNDTDGN